MKGDGDGDGDAVQGQFARAMDSRALELSGLIVWCESQRSPFVQIEIRGIFPCDRFVWGFCARVPA